MSKLILVVDDSRTIRMQVRRALEDADFEVIEAADGAEALDRLRRHPGTALVLCDLRMPGMNGMELLGCLKAGLRIPALPVLMLTTETDREKIEQVRAMGACGWMVKPLKPDMLVAAVRHLTEARQ